MAQQTQDRLSLSPIDSKRATATAASTKRAQEFGKMMLLAGMEADREVNEKQLAVQLEHAAPVEAWNWPATQSVHSVAVETANWPLSQVSQFTAL